MGKGEDKGGGGELIVGSFYMPHREMKHLKNLEASLAKIAENPNRNILLCGDFNCPDIDWENHIVPPGAPERLVQQKLVALAEEYGLHQVQEEPTRERNILDLVFTTNPTLLKASVSTPGISDHSIVISDFCVNPFRTSKIKRKCFLFNKANWEGLRQAATEISNRVSSLYADGADVNTLWKTFKDCLMEASDKNIPSVHRSNNNRIPWMNGKLHRLMKRKKRIYRKAKKSGQWANYRFVQKECKRTFRRAEWDYLNNVIQEGLSQNNSKPFWKYVKSKRQDNVGVAPLKENGSLCSDSKGKANILIQQFKSVFTRPSPPNSG